VFVKQQAMHIPDGFLSFIVSLILWLISLFVIFLAVHKYDKEKDYEKLPLMGVLAAVIFAAQLLNFHVVGGTSGHLLGATLATMLIGPWDAILVMTSVICVQAVIFQDGGLLALGANIFNMAVVGVFVSYVVYVILKKIIPNGKWAIGIIGFIAGWCSVFIAALAAALELAASGTFPANITVPAMGSIHALIGIGEGLITFAVLLALANINKGLLLNLKKPKPLDRFIFIGGIILALLLATLSPLASKDPDGLEKVAANLGFLSRAKESFYRLIPDYLFPGIQDKKIATIIAGVLGVALIVSAALLAYRRNTNKMKNKR